MMSADTSHKTKDQSVKVAEATHLLGGVVQRRCFLLARLLHHLVEDAVGVLQQLAGSVVRVDPSGVEDLSAE